MSDSVGDLPGTEWEIPLFSFFQSGNGNEKVGFTTFEFSAGRRQYCLIAIEYCIPSVLKAKFLQLAPKLGRGHVAKCAQTSNMWLKYDAFWAQNLLLCSAGAVQSRFWWGEKEGKVGILASWGGSGNSHFVPTLSFFGQCTLSFAKCGSR